MSRNNQKIGKNVFLKKQHSKRSKKFQKTRIFLSKSFLLKCRQKTKKCQKTYFLKNNFQQAKRFKKQVKMLSKTVFC